MSKETPTILIVDDNLTNLAVLSGFLRTHGYGIMIAKNGSDGIEKARLGKPDLILLDVLMPDMDGFEACRRLKIDPATNGIPVLFTTALQTVADKVKGFSAGGVDYITKPLFEEEVMARVRTHLRLYSLQSELKEHNRTLDEKVRAQVKEISDAQVATIIALARLAESRDHETGGHLERVGGFCGLLAKRLCDTDRCPELENPDIQILELASALHDIGKVGVPDAILRKQGPGRLLPDEFEIIKQHTVIGARTLEAVQSHYPHNALINVGILIARSHHEKWNGLGYPDGLAGEEIPLFARIVALADVYDALRSRRVYKPAMSHDESCEILTQGSSKDFDPLLVETFVEIQHTIKAMWDERATLEE